MPALTYITAPLGRTRRCRCAAHRMGAVASGLVLTIATIGSLSAMAAFVVPEFVSGEAPAPKYEREQPAHRQEVLEGLAGLIGGSLEVLAVHQRGVTPFVEVVLWLEDAKNPGVIDEDEIAVVSHSRVLRKVTCYTMSLDDRQPSAALDRDSLRAPAFCDAFRADRRVRPNTVAVGVSDIQIGQAPDVRNGLTRLRIALTWPAESADGAGTASVEVDAVMTPAGARE